MFLLCRSPIALSIRRLRGIVPSPASTLPCILKSPTFPCSRRCFHVEGIALAPVVFGGLFVALWTWKCMMMVVFQNKIIYMPGLPPNARWERIDDYKSRCGGVVWREERIRAADGTDLALCVADVDIGQPRRRRHETGPLGEVPQSTDASFYVLYFQGNASSIPPRLPDLSSALCMLKRQMHGVPTDVRVTVACLSYRGYWTSRGRPTEKGIRLDAAAILKWVAQHYDESRAAVSQSPNCQSAQVILWGQSIGSGVATNLAAEQSMPERLHLNSLILETPFTSIRAMLQVLYPQKWLPYQYLWPFLRNQLDSWKNLENIADNSGAEKSDPHIFILEAAKDELVPAELSQKLYDRSIEVGLTVNRKAVSGAFHNDVMFRPEGRKAVSGFIAQRIAAHSSS
ncbi:Alpha/Beta hydrolase protein [Pseudomassariella vexata]|uniref:Alpha/Beta hydrolase protein n=1 Tax=Pseudomassariella vexata TaxID=1141098 RepID=A0A1Y2DD68_9PEZI|nr:Alpha/Beta hydrolase protein [Pseudomassariella vexata]ORY57189.1 Alpha/Beta hydrolase protein [Pseudomassariella vexata]